MPHEPRIRISEVDPGESPLLRAAAAASPKLKFTLNLKKSRTAIIEAVKASREIPLKWQEAILEDIDAIPAEHDFLWLTMSRNPHKDGFNFTFTVCELT
jgi:hypothetical protein